MRIFLMGLVTLFVVSSQAGVVVRDESRCTGGDSPSCESMVALTNEDLQPIDVKIKKQGEDFKAQLALRDNEIAFLRKTIIARVSGQEIMRLKDEIKAEIIAELKQQESNK
jgi:hypothetical protein